MIIIVISIYRIPYYHGSVDLPDTVVAMNDLIVFRMFPAKPILRIIHNRRPSRRVAFVIIIITFFFNSSIRRIYRIIAQDDDGEKIN